VKKAFRFKQFSIVQEKSAMKVGTDGILLGAWTKLSDSTSRVLDIGTGTGLIAMMIAQRSKNSSIEAIEIEKDACEQAAENVKDSIFSNQIQVIHTALQNFVPTSSYDLIICNPPFFENSYLSDDTKRNLARHSQSLSTEDILNFSKEYLSENGTISLILPIAQAEKMIDSSKGDFMLTQRCEVKPKPYKDPHRLLLTFAKENGKKVEMEKGSIVIENEGRHDYTPEYIAMTKSFYIIFDD